MTTAEKLLALKRIPPFDRLRDSELFLVARSSVVRHYRPDHVLCSEESPLQRLHVVIAGSVIGDDGQRRGPVLGAASLLFHYPIETLTAGSGDGATCLVLSRANVHTIVNECPSLLVGFMDLWAAQPALIC